MARPRRRRQYATGSVYQRASDGRWAATIEAGYTKTGARRRIVLTAKTEAEVKRKMERRRAELDRDSSASSVSSRTTVKAWSDTWLAMTAKTARPKTHVTDRGAVNAWIVPTIGHRRLDALTPADVRAVDTAIVAAGKSTSTAKRYRETLSRMLKAAIDEGYPISPRVLAVRAPATAPHDRADVPVPHALKMLAVASTLPHGSRWVAAFLQAMRQGECLGLTWDQVGAETLTVSWQLQALPYLDKHDRSRGFLIPDGYEARQLDRSLHLVRPKTKAGWRVIPLVPVMADALEVLRASGPQSPHGLVWPAANGAPASARQDRDEWNALQDTAGVRHPAGRYWHLHEARHTTATLLMELGVPESVRIAIIGHSSITATHAYEHVDQTQARLALEQVAGRLQLRPGTLGSEPIAPSAALP